ncbi:alpha/beta fold hydrolase [Candidatus Uabimicrobium sp. HlEnr_7]|uniref:alpha/beta fold hydrolase n=1 Tax=Candidatus Uabimicrobium helgolandensis TaxID=3095367 RepID=UPI0035591099
MYILASIVLLIIFYVAIIYFFFPQQVLDFKQSIDQKKAGLTAKKAVIDNYEITYYEGGKGETLVLIHGFSDSKASFLQISKWLTKHYRVILPEVPGFGISAKDKTRHYGIRDQVEFLGKLFSKLQLKEFHLGGNSMGGHISTAYTLRYPQQVKSLLLLNAAGVTVTDGIPYELVEKPIENAEEFDMYMKMLFVNRPLIPGSVRKMMIANAQKNFEWLNYLRTEIRERKDVILNDRVPQIKQRTLILWGDGDAIVVPQVGERYHELLPDSRLIVIPNCGHLPQYEYPKKTSAIMLDFLKEKRE